MRNNTDDIANQIISKIKGWLKNEVENTELDKEILCENNDDFIHFGRRECAEGLLKQIDKWEKENDEKLGRGQY